MHTLFARLNGVSALATTVIMALLAAISLSSFVIPASLEPGSLRMSNLNVIMGRSSEDRGRHQREYAFSNFDVVADLTPLFNWNTKQVFLYLLAEYSTPGYPQNKVVLWDRIVTRRKDARLNIQGGKQKYSFKEISNSFRNASATFELRYDLMPHVGALTSGVVARTEEYKFPPVAARRLEDHR